MKGLKNYLLLSFLLVLTFVSFLAISNQDVKAIFSSSSYGEEYADDSVIENISIDIYGDQIYGTAYDISPTLYSNGDTGYFSYSFDGSVEVVLVADSGSICESSRYNNPCESLRGQYSIILYQDDSEDITYDITVIDLWGGDAWITLEISITIYQSSSSSTDPDPEPEPDPDPEPEPSDTTAPEWWTNDVYYIDSGDSIYVELTDDDSGVWNYYSAASYYKYGWSTSSSSSPSVWEDDFDSERSYKVSFYTIAPTVTSDTTYYLWIYYTGQDNDGNVATYSGKTPYYITSDYVDYLKYEYVVEGSDTTAPTITSYTGGSSSWKYSVTLSINGASDAGVGLASTPYCFTTSSSSNNCSWQSASSFSITTQTDTYYYAFIRDAAGNIKNAGSQQVRVDRTAPVVSGVTVTNSSNGNWTNGSVVITLKGATDAHSGFAKYQYSYDKTTWQNDWDNGCATVNNTKGTWTAERENTIYFRVVDNVGNVSEINDYTYVKIDKTGPDVSNVKVTNSSNDNWTNGSVTITLSGASDAKSGFAKYQYSYDKSTWYNDWDNGYATVNNTKGTWTAERENTVYFRAVDKVGNVSSVLTKTAAIKIDYTAPIMRANSSSGTALTKSTSSNSYDASIRTFYFTDTLSKFSYATLKYSHISSTSTITTASLTLYPGEKCEVTVYDNARNSATYSISLDDNITADNILAEASLSKGKITFTKASSNTIQEKYKNGKVTYFIGKYDNYTTSEALNAGFENYGVTVDASTFFASSLTTPQGLVGNFELYVRLSDPNNPNLVTIFAKSGSLNIDTDDDTTYTTNFALEVEIPIEELSSSQPVALTTSNIVVKESITKGNYLLFVSMILISSTLAIEVIIIKKHKKAHN